MLEETFIHNGWNVLDNEDFRTRFAEVFTRVAKVLTNTLGPYGSTTIIERHGSYHATKDGWSVLKNIRFSDPINNNILQMIIKIAAQVVIKVGDGSTSSVVASSAILEELTRSEMLSKVRPQDLMNTLAKCVEKISSSILSGATQIDKGLDAEFYDVKRLAYIATNSNEEIAGMIQAIYKETRNPSIDFVTSKTNKTSYEIVSGYKIPFMTYLDAVFINNDDNTCVLEDPYIFLVDFKFEFTENLKKMLSFAQMKANENKRKLVIICPFYDSNAMDAIRRIVMADIQSGKDINTIFLRISLINKMAEALYSDFAIMTGATIIRMSDIADAIEEGEEENGPDAALMKLSMTSMGEVSEMSVGKDSTTIKGFIARNELMFEKVKAEAKNTYDEAMSRDIQRDIISSETFDLKRRAARLDCLMGVIHVGGVTELAKESNKDLVEDAVKACESAFNYGYTLGGNLSILRAIASRGDSTAESKLEAEMYSVIKKAFLTVYTAVLANKFSTGSNEDETKIAEILKDTEEDGFNSCYDLLNDWMSTAIINPCLTDIEILKAASSIISYIITSNQYISIVIKEG